MHFVHRPGLPADIPRCLELLAVSPFDSPQHRSALAVMLAELPVLEELIFVVVEDRDEPERGVVGFAASVYLRGAFLSALTHRPQPRLWTRVVEAHSRGESPILMRGEIGRANASGGLCGFSPFHLYDRRVIGDASDTRADVRTRRYFVCIIEAFLEAHRGNRHRKFVKEIYHEGQLALNRRNGYGTNSELGGGLFLIEVSAGQTEVEIGGWLAPIFDYKPPILCFSDPERRLLQTALRDSRIKCAAAALDLSEASVKEYRRAVVDRAMAVNARLARFDDVVAYVRENREELRPYVG